MKRYVYMILFLFILNTGCQEANLIEEKADTTIYQNNDRISEVDPIVISLIGDVMTDSVIGQHIEVDGIDYPLEAVSSVLLSDDLTIANLEMCVSDETHTNKPEGYAFNGSIESLKGLKDGGIDLVSLANNHSMDYGYESLVDTMDHLKEVSIGYVGAGIDSKKAYAPNIIIVNDTTIGVIGVSAVIPWHEWMAKGEEGGVAGFFEQDTKKLIEDTTLLKEVCDIVIVSLHWGTEYSFEPEFWQQQLAYDLIDNGADVVYGHHPHVLQGVEIYNDRYIIYSTGNFVFHQNGQGTDESGIFQLSIKDQEVDSCQYIPVCINEGQPYLVSEAECPQYYEKLGRLSEMFYTSVNERGIIISE